MQNQNKKLQQGLNWLKKETEKDKLEIQTHKNQLINELKQLDKSEMFKPEIKK